MGHGRRCYDPFLLDKKNNIGLLYCGKQLEEIVIQLLI